MNGELVFFQPAFIWSKMVINRAYAELVESNILARHVSVMIVQVKFNLVQHSKEATRELAVAPAY